MQMQSTRATRGAPTVPATCRQCGTAFLTWAYKIAQGKASHCSRACYTAARSTGRTGPTLAVRCVACGREFLTWPYRILNGIAVCSRDCRTRLRLRGENRACEVCGSTFYFKASRGRQGQAGRFCSHACAGKWNATQRESTGRDSANNRDWRNAVKARDSLTCRHCGTVGTSRTMHAHHIKGWHAFPELRFDVNNGITLCRRCHGKIHGGPNAYRR